VDARELYKAMLERVDEMPATADDVARYQVEQEDFFQSADSFRAWLLAGQLQGQLKARFGPAWWRSPEAGAFLKGLWARGNALSAREVAQAIGEKAIAPDVLLLRLSTTLQVPMTLDTKTEEAPPAAPAPETPAKPEPAAPQPSATGPTSAREVRTTTTQAKRQDLKKTSRTRAKKAVTRAPPKKKPSVKKPGVKIAQRPTERARKAPARTSAKKTVPSKRR
jgi:hypothetical protein